MVISLLSVLLVLFILSVLSVRYELSVLSHLLVFSVLSVKVTVKTVIRSSHKHWTVSQSTSQSVC